MVYRQYYHCTTSYIVVIHKITTKKTYSICHIHYLWYTTWTNETSSVRTFFEQTIVKTNSVLHEVHLQCTLIVHIQCTSKQREKK